MKFFTYMYSNINWQVTSRAFSAIFVGYLFTFSVGTLLSYLIPLPKSEAVLTISLASFLIYSGAIIWAFSSASVKSAWLGLLIPTAAASAAAIAIKLSGVLL